MDQSAKIIKLMESILEEEGTDVPLEQFGMWVIQFVNCFVSTNQTTQVLLKASITNFLLQQEGGAEQFLFAVNRAFNVVDEVEDGNAN